MTSVFQRARKGIKAQDEDTEFDVREDEEQSVKREETIQLLLAAGYFRARIKGLDDFDKVVGGMVWCITASNVDVDVDLLFQENSTIGQKITLTEKIVAALNRMSKSVTLEPHQIQGMDFKSIFPVIQWLVKRTLEARREKEQVIRRRAMVQFHRTLKTPEEEEFENRKSVFIGSLHLAKESYKPRRQYKPRKTRKGVDEMRVQGTLLEYGRRYGISKKKKDESAKEKNAIAQSLGDDEEDKAKREEENIKKLMTGMADASEGAVSTDAIESMFTTQSAAIAELSSAYAKHAAEMSSSEAEKGAGKAAHKRALASLNKQKEKLTAKVAQVRAELEEVENNSKDIQAQLEEVRAKRGELEEEAKRLDDLEGDEANQPIIAALQKYVNIMDTLRAQLKSFKATCTSEMGEWEKKIDNLKASGAVHIDEQRAMEIREQFEAETAKLNKLRVRASKKTRQIALYQRKMDEIPSRSELSQYQRRFNDLSEQMNGKFRETKQFITLYNINKDIEKYFMKEQTLLTSIHENFPKAMGSKANAQALIKQLDAILEGINKNKEMLQNRSDEEKTHRDELRDQHLALLDTERVYTKTIRDYEREMAKNEKLTVKLEKGGKK
eukprot:m.159156 g.159156  ORF g.159156 m.159156 type:complete len:611 (-) comp13365_c0_seq5:124-1956(-)